MGIGLTGLLLPTKKVDSDSGRTGMLLCTEKDNLLFFDGSLKRSHYLLLKKLLKLLSKLSKYYSDAYNVLCELVVALDPSIGRIRNKLFLHIHANPILPSCIWADRNSPTHIVDVCCR